MNPIRNSSRAVPWNVASLMFVSVHSTKTASRETDPAGGFTAGVVVSKFLSIKKTKGHKMLILQKNMQPSRPLNPIKKLSCFKKA